MYSLYLKSGDTLTVNFMHKNKFYRLFMDTDTIKLYEIFENINDKCVINMEDLK